MSIEELTVAHPWEDYSQKLSDRILHPVSAGAIDKEEAKERGVHLAVGEEGSLEEENLVRIFFMVDLEEGLILEARFQVFGQSVLIGLAEAACEFLIGKNYDQACHLNVQLLDKYLRDRPENPSYPLIFEGYGGMVVDAVIKAAEQCSGIPLAETYVPPMPPVDLGNGQGYPGWIKLAADEKLRVLEQVLDEEVRPYIAMDGGGISILRLIDDKELVISYQGTCTTCMSSVGATLSYIQQVVQAKVDPGLRVIPDLDQNFGQ